MSSPLPQILSNLHAAATAPGRPTPALLAVSKTQPADAVAELAAQGQRAFGENYVQEALDKMQALQHLPLEWHLIGHLQSNKADAVATHFDWVQSVDRPRLVTALARHRPAGRASLNVLIQVNIDDEASKHGCTPEAVDALAAAIAAELTLRLRGLMAIPAPWPDAGRRHAAFARMRALFDTLALQHAHVDTLSMGMSSDYAEAIAEGATLVRIGTALFGARPRPA
ncbi:MAG: Pyridoxal phosphate homeostasis protein [Stenotrophomonas maltophilia]|nr:MAG: Pyridoxal phosphate homeostasis protein [Stenotrophomonas maltophilia]